MKYFKKILLPSNGLEYDAFIDIRPLDLSFLLVLEDPFFNFSQTEIILTIIQNHCQLNFKIEEMYFSDLMFLWFLLFYSANNLQNIEFPISCSSCKKELQFSIPIQELDIVYNSKRIEDYVYTYNDIQIYFDYRRVKHNLYSASLLSNGNLDVINTYSSFIFPQIKKIVKNEKEYTSDYLNEIIKYFGFDFLSDVLKFLKKEPFGIQNNLSCKCSYCNTITNTPIIDSFSYSFPNNLELVNLKLINKIYEIVLNLIDSKYLSFTESLGLTYSNLNLLQQKIIEFQKKKSGPTYLDEFQ